MRFFDKKILIYDTETGYRASDMTVENLELLGGVDKVNIRIDPKSNLLVAELKRIPLTMTDKIVINDWIGNALSGKASKEQLKNMLTGLFSKPDSSGRVNNFSEELIETLVEIPFEIKAKKDNTLEDALEAYAVGDKLALDEIRRRIIRDDAQFNHSNKTLRQESPEEDLYFKLPSADDLCSHQVDEDFPDTGYSRMVNPYPNILYYRKSIVNILSSTSEAAMLQNIEHAIEVERNTYKTKLNDETVRDLRMAFQRLPIEYVIGNTDNDTLEVQENEQGLYDNLVEFIRYHIYRNHRDYTSETYTEEELQELTEKDFKAGNLPLRLKVYFERLLYDVLSLHFGFTGNFNYVYIHVEKEDYDSYENKNEEDDVDDKDRLIVTKDSHKESDLHLIAADYIDQSAKVFGAGVWAEAIIKSMRWGERKIKNLNIGVNNTQYLDLQSLQILEQQLSDLTNFAPVRDAKGRYQDVLARIPVDLKGDGDKRASNYPFLLIIREEGTLPNSDSLVKLSQVTTLFDLVRQYRLGKEVLFDISYVNGKFVEEHEGSYSDLPEIDFENLAEYKIKPQLSDELLDFGIDNAVPLIKGTADAIMRRDVIESFIDSTPVVERLVGEAGTSRNDILQGTLLYIFNQGAKTYDEDDFIGLLNFYNEEIYDTHAELYKELLGINSMSNLNARNLATASYFNETEEDVVEVEANEEDDEGGLKFVYKTLDSAGRKFSPLVIQTKTGETHAIVGGIAAVEKGVYLFASENEVPEFAVNATPISVGKMTPVLLGIMVGADQGNDFTDKHFVVSESTVSNIFLKFNSVLQGA